MERRHSSVGDASDRYADRSSRRHPRSTVFKAARVYPLLREASFLVGDVSPLGVMGRCALPLSLNQCVHLTFDDREFVAAEVRWAQGDRYGLQLAEPSAGLTHLCEPGVENTHAVAAPATAGDGSGAMRRRARRVVVALPATLMTTLPIMPGLVRNISRGGMLIEVGTRLREGGRLLVKMRDQPTIIGRIQWSKLGCAGLQFANELPAELVPEVEPSAIQIVGAATCAPAMD